jgi:hypothetical protein
MEKTMTTLTESFEALLNNKMPTRDDDYCGCSWEVVDLIDATRTENGFSIPIKVYNELNAEDRQWLAWSIAVMGGWMEEREEEICRIECEQEGEKLIIKIIGPARYPRYRQRELQ